MSEEVAAVQQVVSKTTVSNKSFYYGVAISIIVVVCVIAFMQYAPKLKQRLAKMLVPATAEPVMPMEPEEQIERSPFVKDVQSDLEAINTLTGTGKPKVVLVHAPWCGHCRNMMADFVKSSSTDHNTEWYRIDSKVSPSVTRRSDLKGFPTIYGVAPDGTLSQHTGARDSASLLAFAKKLLDSVPVIVADAGAKAVSFSE